MKIRSITLGVPVGAGVAPSLAEAGRALVGLEQRFTQAGYEVQTTRASLPPLGGWVAADADLTGLAREIETAATEAGIGYVALGPVRWSEGARSAACLAAGLAEALAATERVFGSIETADARGLQLAAIPAAGGIMRALAETTEQGFGNLRFAALANCPPGIPFFPAAYHASDQPAFSLALQAADLARRAFGEADSPADAEARLTAVVDAELSGLERIALEAEAQLGVRYAGADPTMAPFPSDDESIGAAIELLGVGRFGSAGTLTAAALITRALRAVGGRRCGFAGVMLPVLEDSVLARRAAEGCYGWPELLLYSAVCGTGLDTVPLPGDVTADELASIILDLSSLAVALQKPLTCRLFPVPGKAAGELTTFDFPFFANGGVLPAGGPASPELLRRALADGRP